MILTFLQATGSPLAARMNPVIYVALILGIFLVVIFAGLALLYNKMKAKQQTPEWIEAHKNLPSKKSDIDMFAAKYKLSDELSAFLWRFCKKYKIKNFFYNFKETEYLEEYYRQYYEYCRNSDNQKEINLLFKTKFELERIIASSANVTSTKALVKDWKISEIFPDGSKLHFKVYENAKDYLSISITEDYFKSEDKPGTMEKVAFTFKTEVGMKYAFVSRLMRYEQNKDGFCMLVSHSTDLIAKVARNFKRMAINERCRIASVKVETDRKGKKNMIPAEQKFDCAISNISGGGCCISTTLPVKEEQNIYVELNINNEPLPVFGKIVKTRRAKTAGLFNLHIQFSSISIDVQNKILAKVYQYN